MFLFSSSLTGHVTANGRGDGHVMRCNRTRQDGGARQDGGPALVTATCSWSVKVFVDFEDLITTEAYMYKF